MYISILDPTVQTLSHTGSSLRRLIQNNKDPLLDLFVRESIQNCLDAGSDEFKEQFVKVEFLTGNFNKIELNSHLELLSKKINEKFSESSCQFIAVKDSNTTGLSGPLKSSDVQNGEFGNLQKLVYQICKPQEEKGAGGSWGIGKTTYYRVGEIGLVLFYSRIKNDDGRYESRLCAAMVEDETKPDALLPAAVPERNNKSGIAWWGAHVDKNENSYPITDDNEINAIINIFGINPFCNEETGTVVIIPYIDEDKLLRDTQTELKDENGDDIINSWDNDLTKYLEVAVQRWYAPRISNPTYYRKKGEGELKNFKYLKVWINGNEFETFQMKPIFRVIQDLYNTAIGHARGAEIQLLSNLSKEDIIVKPLTYNRLLGVNDNILGRLVHVKVKKDSVVTDQDLSPYSFVNITTLHNSSSEFSSPIICMTRRPGMIVEYNSATWIKDLPKSASDELILAIFVLDSKEKVTEDVSLEEYIRIGGETADHIGWTDHPINKGEKSKNIVSTIISKTTAKLKEAYSTQEKRDVTSIRAGLGAFLGKVLNIKRTAKGHAGPKRRKERQSESGSVKYVVLDNIVYKEDSMELTLIAETKKKAKDVRFDLGLMTDSGDISILKWEEETQLDGPFSIKECIINVMEFDKKTPEEVIDVNNPESSSDYLIYKKVNTPENKWVGLSVSTNDSQKHSFKLEMVITIHSKRRDIIPCLTFKK